MDKEIVILATALIHLEEQSEEFPELYNNLRVSLRNVNRENMNNPESKALLKELK